MCIRDSNKGRPCQRHDRRKRLDSYAVLCFGGFLGMGRKHLPIPWSRLKYDLVLEAYLVDITDEELHHAPDYEADEDFDWGDRSQEMVVRNYYRSPHYWSV